MTGAISGGPPGRGRVQLGDVDPQARLADVLARVADHKITELAALLPLELPPHNRCGPRWLSAAAPTSAVA
ncbi:MAG TPA: transposase domain-containing protein, partial [Xanthobacteraceae bacterium]